MTKSVGRFRPLSASLARVEQSLSFRIRSDLPSDNSALRHIPMHHRKILEMNIISKNIKWVMLVSGLLTGTMLYAAIAPEAALMSTFGESVRGPIAEIVVRNWGALITLVGGLLIYGAFQPLHRPLILVFSSISKVIFIGLVLTFGNEYLGKAGLIVAFDSVVVTVFIIYLLTAKRDG